MMILLTPSALLRVLQTLTTTSTTASSRLPYPDLTVASIPFTRKSLTEIRAALTTAQDYAPVVAGPKEGQAAVLIPLCSVNDQCDSASWRRAPSRSHIVAAIPFAFL